MVRDTFKLFRPSVAVERARVARRHGTLERKGSRISPSHLDILVSRRRRRRRRRRMAGTLRAGRWKYPHRARKTVFFPRCTRSLYSACLPSIAAPLRTGPDVALSRARARARARLFFFGANDREHVARRLASCVELRRATALSVTFTFVQRARHWRKYVGIYNALCRGERGKKNCLRDRFDDVIIRYRGRRFFRTLLARGKPRRKIRVRSWYSGCDRLNVASWRAI